MAALLLVRAITANYHLRVNVIGLELLIWAAAFSTPIVLYAAIKPPRRLVVLRWTGAALATIAILLPGIPWLYGEARPHGGEWIFGYFMFGVAVGIPCGVAGALCLLTTALMRSTNQNREW